MVFHMYFYIPQIFRVPYFGCFFFLLFSKEALCTWETVYYELRLFYLEHKTLQAKKSPKMKKEKCLTSNVISVGALQQDPEHYLFLVAQRTRIMVKLIEHGLYRFKFSCTVYPVKSEKVLNKHRKKRECTV